MTKTAIVRARRFLREYALPLIEAERERQIKLFGELPTKRKGMAHLALDTILRSRLIVLMEEVGEVAADLLDLRDGKLRKALKGTGLKPHEHLAQEIVQVAAVAVSMLDVLWDREWTVESILPREEPPAAKPAKKKGAKEQCQAKQ